MKEPIEIISLEDKEITLIGTAHISETSVKTVEKFIKEKKPDCVSIELCEPRLNMLINENEWENTDIVKILKEKKLFFLLVRIFLSSLQEKAGEQVKVKPGAEMKAAYEEAKANDIDVELIDREVQTTLLRIWNSITFWTKIKLFFAIIFSSFNLKSLSKEKIEEMKTIDEAQELTDAMGRYIPDIKKYLIDERDLYMSQKLVEIKKKNILAVVGAGHLYGMKKALLKKERPICQLEKLNEIPPKKSDLAGFIIKWSIPVFLVGVMAYGFSKGLEKGFLNLSIWIFINGSFSALGVLIGGGYLRTIIGAFLLAPLTSITPLVGVAYFTAYIEVTKRKPTVKDLKEVKSYINKFSLWRKNRLTKILYISLLSGLGSTIATYLAAYLIVSS